jgi:hypothetical protein
VGHLLSLLILFRFIFLACSFGFDYLNWDLYYSSFYSGPRITSQFHDAMPCHAMPCMRSCIAHMHACIHTMTYTYAYACTYVRTYVRTHVRICTYVCARLQTTETSSSSARRALQKRQKSLHLLFCLLSAMDGYDGWINAEVAGPIDCSSWSSQHKHTLLLVLSSCRNPSP